MLPIHHRYAVLTIYSEKYDFVRTVLEIIYVCQCDHTSHSRTCEDSKEDSFVVVINL